MSATSAKIVQTALSYVGSTDWAYAKEKDNFSANTHKCNKFVYDVMVAVGVTPPPQVPKYVVLRRPPTAGEWADPNVHITGWEVVQKPQPGDVIAEAHAYVDATGHVGIVVAPNLTVSATKKSVVKNDWGFRQKNTPVYRRYVRPFVPVAAPPLYQGPKY